MGKTVHVAGFLQSVNAKDLKDFLENRIGLDTVAGVQVRQPKTDSPKVYAIVQFTQEIHAASIISRYRASPHTFMYTGWPLRIYEQGDDFITSPIGCSFYGLKMHFGCQISAEKFFVLWTAEDVCVVMDTGMRKLCFSGTSDVDYRLEVPYEQIRQVDLHSPPEVSSRFLVIELIRAPKIFVKDEEADKLLEFYKYRSDQQLIRTTDFTSSNLIGQSTAVCLEFPHQLNIPDFTKEFAHFSEHQPQNFDIQLGLPYSSNATTLVPIVEPPASCGIPFEILFKVNSMMQTGCLPGPVLDVDFFKLLDPRSYDRVLIDYCLDKLSRQKKCCYDPKNWLNEEYKQWIDKGKSPQSPLIPLKDGLIYMYRVQITPARVFFCGPEVNVSNGVIRHYSDYINDFLRISFVDEDLGKIRPMDLSSRSSTQRRTKLYNRINSVLHEGFSIGDKKFEFLAFSSSQVRESSAWMFASNNKVTAADIRDWMGDFRDIRNVAKYAARLGQSLSSSRETLKVEQSEIENIPDVEVSSYVFSDGIGKISAEFAGLVARKCDLRQIDPSAFQIRFGGYKGVVAIDPNSSKKLSLRNSMRKFKSQNSNLDVLAWTKYQPCYLNRQVITLLSSLGVGDNVFEEKQREFVQNLDASLNDPLIAQEALVLMAPGEDSNMLKELLTCYKPNCEPFLSMMLQNFRASKLLEIQTKSRIFIEQGRSMMGCLDETSTLEYGQVFVQFSEPTRPDSQYFITGRVVVAKNPCLHPGDVRVLEAVEVPALSHMVDCVVFPQKGARPHPNECSGSDLDGDMYFVCWDKDLIPPKTCKPVDYTPEPPQILDHDVTIEEVKGYFLDFIVTDSVGMISNAHTAFADKEPNKAFSKECIELAKKFSIAVDYPKTGIAAEIPPHLYVKEYPDFMEKLDKPTYESKNVIGKLFREVKKLAPPSISIKSFTLEVASKCYDKDMEIEGFQNYIEGARNDKANYDYKLGNLMDYYGIKTEAEIFSFSRRSDAESIGKAVMSLRKEALLRFNERKGDEAFDEMAKASAWYHVTYHPDYWGVYNEDLKRDHFLSFPWCVYDKLVKIKKENERKPQLGIM